MSRNGSGTFNLTAGNPVVTGTTISSTWANTTLSDIANGLTQSVAADGQTPITGNLQMGGHDLQNVGTISTTGLSVIAQNLGGTTGAIKLFDYTGNNASNIVQWINNSESSQYAYIKPIITGGLIFGNQSYEVMRYDSNNNLLIGTASGSDRVNISFAGNTQNGMRVQTNFASLGSNYLSFYNSAGANTGTINQNGTTTVAYTTSSDYRLKDNVIPMQNALATVAKLKPVTYKWKSDGSDGQGFIAHELQAVIPDCVTGEKDALDSNGNPKYQGIDTSFLVATLTAAIQELKAEFDEYKITHP